MSRITADVRTSPPPDWKPEGLIRTPELWVAYNAARDRLSSLKNGDKVAKKPLEFETTAFWEDLYHKVLLPGYSHNSQQPPNDTSDKRCDIVTRYFDDKSQRRTLIFTEAKRASEFVEPGGIDKMEAQVKGYCLDYLKAKGSQDRVYACTVVGPYIRCFIVHRAGKNLEPLWAEEPGRSLSESYLDPASDRDVVAIKAAFREMTLDHPPSKTAMLPNYETGSYKSSPPGRASPSGSSPSRGYSREPHLPQLPPAEPLDSERELGRRERSLTTRSMSPREPSAGPSGYRGQSSTLSYRERSPPQALASSSRQAPRGSLPTPSQAVALIESWGDDFNSTTFLVRDRQSGESFRKLGGAFQKGTVQTETGQVPCYFASHNNLRVFVLSLDPKSIERTGSAAKASRPRWAKK